MKLWVRFAIAGTIVCSNIPAETMGIINGGGTYVALLDNSFVLTTVPLPGLTIAEVAMNSSGNSVMGGSINGGLSPNWAGLVNSSGQITPFSNNGIDLFANLSRVAINSSGNAIAAGGQNGFVSVDVTDPFGNATFLDNNNTLTCDSNFQSGTVSSSALNEMGWGIVGGNTGQGDIGVFAYTIAPGSYVTNKVLCIFTNPSASKISGVAINNSNNSIAGGFLNNAPYTVLFKASDALPIFTQVSFPFAQGRMNSVSIADSGAALIGGVNTLTNTPFAALVNPAGQFLPPLSGPPIPSTGVINSVDLVDGFGYGIIAGQDTTNQAAYLAYVDILGNVHPISGLPTGPNASISSVSLNAWGTALVGGTIDGVQPYAALIDPIQGVIALDVSGSGVSNITSVSIRNSPFVIAPFNLNLTGNNLTFAKYLVRYAPTKASYFSPSVFNGTLAKALESAIPTRNAISVYTADNNLLFLSHSLSTHLCNHRYFRKHGKRQSTATTAALENTQKKFNRFLVSADQETAPTTETTSLQETTEETMTEETPASEPTAVAAPSQEEPVSSEPEQTAPTYIERHIKREHSNSLWSQAIGAFASQKEQRQTPGFKPSMGGIMIGWDQKTDEKSLAGVGTAYAFTHISEKEDAGYSRINQEYLFGYASWMNEHLYFDGVLWLGAFQIHQVRDIDMTGFAFTSTSSPIGWQLSPHAEFGYDHGWMIGTKKELELTLDPFVMLDWVNAWQMTYKERGNSPFNAGQKAYYSSLLRTEVGLRFYQTLYFQKWLCTFEEKGSYVNKAPFEVGRMTAFLVGSPGSFTVETLTQLQNLGVVEAALIFEPVDQSYPYGSLSYQGEFCPSYQSHQISGEVSWDF